MNTIPNRPTLGGDEVDRLLTSFYCAEMPAQWPAAPQPWTTTPAAATRWRDPHTRSRWALAASVALLFGACWYLSGHVTGGKRGPNRDFDNGGADAKYVKDLIKDKNKTP